MKKQKFLAYVTICSLLIGNSSLEASKKKPFPCQEEADNYLITHFNLGCKYYNKQDWRSAIDEFEKVIYFFPCSEIAAEASYYLAVSYFEKGEYDFANTEFSSYIKASDHPEFFEDAVYYKFCIAEYLKKGRKRRPFKNRYLPKCIDGQDLALTIYDEVVAALPNHELTIQALYSKADLLRKMGEFRLSIETFQTIIRRFPKDKIVPVCFVSIAEAYVEQSRFEFQNPDILALAELNARRFEEEFPRDENVPLVNATVMKIKELYAQGLCDLGKFYERIKQPEAAIIYYQSSIEEFPDTHVAELCRSRILILRSQLGMEEECGNEVCCGENENLSINCSEETDRSNEIEENSILYDQNNHGEILNEASSPEWQNPSNSCEEQSLIQTNTPIASTNEFSYIAMVEPTTESFVEQEYPVSYSYGNEEIFEEQSSFFPEESIYVPSYESPYEQFYKPLYVPKTESFNEAPSEQSYESSYAPHFKQTGKSPCDPSQQVENTENWYMDLEPEPQKEESPAFIHYSLLKKREVKHAQPVHKH